MNPNNYVYAPNGPLGYQNNGEYHYANPAFLAQHANRGVVVGRGGGYGYGYDNGNGYGYGNGYGNVNGYGNANGYGNLIGVGNGRGNEPVQQQTPTITPRVTRTQQTDDDQYPLLPPPEVFSTNTTTYTVIRVLEAPRYDSGAMSFGVRMIEDQKGNVKVQKRLRMDSSERRFRASVEKSALKQIASVGGSPNINHIFEAFLSDGTPHCSLVLEYCDRQTLDHYARSLAKRGAHLPQRPTMPESFAWHILAGVSAALSMIHYGIVDPAHTDVQIPNWNTICHLDIKPANVFLSNKQITRYPDGEWPTIVLGDFGCAVLKSDINNGNADKDFQSNGTQGWFPPETVGDSDGWTGVYGKTTDVWQMGGVVHSVCRLLAQPLQMLADEGRPCGSKYSSQLNAIVSHLMKRDPTRRPASSEAADLVWNQMVALRLIDA